MCALCFQMLRNSLSEVKDETGKWPPSGSQLTLDAAERCVPPLVFNFLTWVTGFSHEPDVDNFVEVPPKAKLKILSMAQDLVALMSRNRVLKPKQLALAMTVRHLTSCSSLISILNGLGHCVAVSTCSQHEQDLAILHTTEDDIIIPDGIQQGILPTSIYAIHVFSLIYISDFNQRGEQ